MTYIAYFVKKANPTTPIPRRPISRSNTQVWLVMPAIDTLIGKKT